MFFKFLTQSVHLGGGGIRSYNPPEDGALLNFQPVLLLNIGDTEQHTVGP